MNNLFLFSLAMVPPFALWVGIFMKREDLRREMIVMSIIVGLIALVFARLFWAIDLPAAEDFIAGFLIGGVVAVIYEAVFKKTLHERKRHHHTAGAFTIILILAALLLFFFYVLGLTSFWATAISFIFVAGMTVLMRHDLFINAVLSGALMTMVALVSYCLIMLASWNFSLAVPVQEIIFWFLAGCVFGPFYEYWQGERLFSTRGR